MALKNFTTFDVNGTTIVDGLLYQHRKSGKLYKVVQIADWQQGRGVFVAYLGQRNGKRYGPWRTASPASFAANFAVLQ